MLDPSQKHFHSTPPIRAVCIRKNLQGPHSNNATYLIYFPID